MMSKFIRVTVVKYHVCNPDYPGFEDYLDREDLSSEEPMYLNVANIINISSKQKGSWVYLSSKEGIHTKESAEEIIEMINRSKQ